jgi:hypothetical protein
MAVAPEHARALLAAVRAPRALLRASADPVGFAHELFAMPLPVKVAEALHRVVALASVRGHLALLEAAADVGVDASSWHDMAPANLAAAVVALEARGDTAAERCVERALVRLARLLPTRLGYELCARRAPSSARFAAALATVPGLLRAPWVAADDDGTLHAAVLWAQGERSRAEVEGKRTLRYRARRALRADLVTLHPTGRVTVESALPARALLVAEALAAPVFGDARAFRSPLRRCLPPWSACRSWRASSSRAKASGWRCARRAR